MKGIIKKSALDNGVPQEGAEAFRCGWDDRACPFNYEPRRSQWLAEYTAASIKSYLEWLRVSPRPTPSSTDLLDDGEDEE
jgi:hypothetical protein